MSLDTSSNIFKHPSTVISINQPCRKKDINAAQKLCQVIVLSTPMTSCAAPQPLRKLCLHMPFLRQVSSFHDFIIQYAKKKIIVNHATCSTMLYHNVWYHVLIIVITRKYIVDNHVISYHIRVTMMGALDEYSCQNDASFHASHCFTMLYLIILHFTHIIHAVFALWGQGPRLRTVCSVTPSYFVVGSFERIL